MKLIFNIVILFIVIISAVLSCWLMIVFEGQKIGWLFVLLSGVLIRVMYVLFKRFGEKING